MVLPIIHFAHPKLLFIFLPVSFIALVYRLKWYKPPVYQYPLAGTLESAGCSTKHPYRAIIFGIHSFVLILLAFLIAQPQWVDVRSQVRVQGIDIILALDVSESMVQRDYHNDTRSRLDIAKEEAIRFISKRPNDAIGIVLFGKDVLPRVPLTLDKQLLTQVIQELKIGVIDYRDTMLSCAVVSAANRLKDSKAKSKIIILLTDGEPSQGDCDPEVALDVAKKLGIKIYTVGIGSNKNEVMVHPVYGLITKPKINTTLLTQLAKETGGTFFQAASPTDMRRIYDTIDTLEKTVQVAPQYHIYYELFIPGVWVIMLALLFVLIATTFFWFGI